MIGPIPREHENIFLDVILPYLIGGFIGLIIWVTWMSIVIGNLIDSIQF